MSVLLVAYLKLTPKRGRLFILRTIIRPLKSQVVCFRPI